MKKIFLIFISIILIFLSSCDVTQDPKYQSLQTQNAILITKNTNLNATLNASKSATPKSSNILGTPPRPVNKPITWKQLVDFLASDHTNWNEYDINSYVCLDFAIDLVENAKKQNINARIVAVDFVNGDTGHAFVAFETSDKGTIFIEPQGDNTYSNVVIGNLLCDDWGKYECMGKIAALKYYDECTHDHYCH